MHSRIAGVCAAAVLATTACAPISAGLTTAPLPSASQARIAVPASVGGPARPDRPITVTVTNGRLTEVNVTGPDGALEGTLSKDARIWVSTLHSLEFGTSYSVKANAVDRWGTPTQTTADVVTLVASRRLHASIAPTEGDIVGVGMPITVHFDRPVHGHDNRAAVESKLQVVSSTPVEGAWSWAGDRDVLYRPRSYWPGHANITVRASLKGVHLSKSVWGQGNVETHFQTGAAMVSSVNMNTHELTVKRDGQVLRVIPITTGKPGFASRSGIKVIMSKERNRIMDAATGGTSKKDPEYYRLNVEYAMRITWTGEFLHAAPWSVYAQGHQNVSHGCTGMSTSNGAWFYANSRPGDVVSYTGSDRQVESGNGITVWNVSWSDWLRGSALHGSSTGDGTSDGTTVPGGNPTGGATPLPTDPVTA